MNTYQQSFNVSFDYPVAFTRDLFAQDNLLLAETIDRLHEGGVHRALFFVDDGVAHCHPELNRAITAYATTHADRLEVVLPPRVVPGGERVKNDYRLTMEMVDLILACKLCRHSYVVAVGGGAVLDAVGFATSIVHRGLRLIRVPTTVLAQNDAGVGVKNGMNLHGGKNTVGTFAPPFAVLNDFAFLATLDEPAWRDGIAEAFKVAMVEDRDFFDFLCAGAKALDRRDPKVMETLVERCARLHLDHIRRHGDPFEVGRSRPLDFGHWSAHRLEGMSNYEISHGAAVAIGIALDSIYAHLGGHLDTADLERLLRGLDDAGLILWDERVARRLGDGTLEILQGLDDFREHLGGMLTVTLPDGVGHRREVNEMDPARIEQAVQHLKARAAAALHRS